MCYSYDELSRVTKRTIKNLCDEILSEESYTYDAAGNIAAAPIVAEFIQQLGSMTPSFAH